ncbi:MAG: ATP-binding protein [Rikenellaceae bacterium]
MRLFYALILLVSILPVRTYSQVNYAKTQLVVNDGLSQGDVLDILQDSYGYIWIATNDGLNRYDGYDFTTYSIGDRGLESNLIVSLVEDKLGNIWVGTTSDGLYYYIREENRFYHITALTYENWIKGAATLKYLRIDDNGLIWAYDSISHHVFKITFDYQTLRIDDIKLYSFTEDNSGIVNEIIAHDGALYLATNIGVLTFSESENAFVGLHERLGGYVWDVDIHNSYLFVLYEKRLMSMNLEDQSIKTFGNFPGGFHIEWCGDSLWGHSHNGVYRSNYDRGSNTLSVAKSVDEFQDMRANVIAYDNSEGVWVGFMKAGLCHYEPDRKPFAHFTGHGNDHILPLTLFGDQLWVGTEGSGVYIYNQNRYDRAKEQIFNGEIIYAMERSPFNGKHYISTTKDIFCVDPKSYISQPMSVGGTYRALIADSVYMWAASYGFGITRYDLRDNSKITLTQEASGLPSNIVRNLMIDSRGDLWICTDKGLALIDREQLYLSEPVVEPVVVSVESNHYTIPIIEDKLGRIWYGTLGRGLHCLTQLPSSYMPDKKGRKYGIKSYTIASGLSNNSIKAIAEDEDGNIWVSSNRGICCLNPTSDKIRIYDRYDGLQDYEFNELSVAKLPSGEILFGGVNGFNKLLPDFIEEEEPIHTRPIITDFRIFNKSVFDDDDNVSLIPCVLEPGRGVRLKYNQDSFSFRFAAPNYSNSAKNIYRYKLDGYDADYIKAHSDNRVASYVNVPSGNYTFRLQSTNDNGLWSDEELTMPITIVAPVWARWYSYLLYYALFAFGLWILASYYRRRMKRESAMAIIKMERNKAHEMLEMRTKFFTNISHEFRTPLTLIISPLQKIMSQSPIASDPQWQTSLKTMEHNANSLLRLINELLAYVKQESGKLRVEMAYHNFSQIASTLLHQFQFWTEQRNITLKIEIPESPIYLYFDKYMMEQIIYNLISNAIKHTPAGGTVSFCVEEREDDLRIEVHDTGIGISKVVGKRLFERFASFNLNNLSDTGGIGIGLILTKSLVKMHNGEIWFESEESRGTSFFVSIPKHITDDQQTESGDEVDPMHVSSQEEAQYAQESEAQLEWSHEDGSLPQMLVVDDNPDLLLLLKDMFSSYYSVESAEGGREGIDKALSLIPDIIISDVMMPEVDGLELCATLKEDSRTSHIPIVLLTAKSAQSDIAEGYRNLADAYCTKPFNNAVLIETVNSIVRNRIMLADRLMSSTKQRVAEEEEAEPTTGSSSAEESITNLDKEFLKKLTDYVEENIGNNDFAVSDICTKMGMTPRVLNKKLRSLLNTTANALIRNIRLHRAASLLQTGRYSISDVTYDVGFSDLRYFRECFEKEFGVLPQTYKDNFLSESPDQNIE